MTSEIEEFYENRSTWNWNPMRPLAGRDKDIFPFIPKAGGQVVDFGFGVGSLIPTLTNLFDRTIAVEISQTAIDSCREHIKQAQPSMLERLEFVKTSGTDIPGIPDGSCDVAICASVLEHVFDMYAVLDSLRRVTKPGGLLLATVPNIAYLKYRVQLLMGILPITGTDAPVTRWRESGWDGGHIHYFTKDTTIQLLDDCGWVPETWSGAGDRWPWLRPFREKFPTILSGELIVLARAK